MFERVLIANRGEIACRVIRTCCRLGIHTIAVYSEADQDAQHVRLADEAWPIGGPLPADSYLRIDAILDAAKNSGAQGIHPGYGFLSENTAFSRACRDAGIVFIGPDPESIEAMGSKAAAKQLMARHDVPLVPGYSGDQQDNAFLAEQAHQVGYPLIIKPSAGGGGKGMQIVRSDAEFPERHIEFQIFGDRHGNIIHLGERECSAQRRYQKVLEETPSPFLTPEKRADMGAAAVAAARAVNYVGAGTVEFIVGPAGDFHFMEMNTRLQVEHPVTELTHGVDLVEWQLRIADGEPLPLAQQDVVSRGHAIEVRLYAEDPDQNFLPGSGKLQTLRLPSPSQHVRLDGGVIEGDTVTIFYDPMIAKLIVWDEDRPKALQRMREALAASEIIGPKSNIGFLERLVRHPVVVEGNIDTGYLDRHLEEFLVGDVVPGDTVLFAAATAVLLHDEASIRGNATDPHSPWARADAWRIGHAGKRIVALTWREQRYDIDAHGHAGNYQLRRGAAACEVRGARLLDDGLSARFAGESQRVPLRVDAAHVLLHDAHGQRYSFSRAAAFAWEATDAAGGNQIIAPMPGRIVLVKANAGDTVEQGQELLVMEAMKMELALKAPRAGTIESINATQGEFVEADAVLVRFAD